jgi:hypothetical protein
MTTKKHKNALNKTPPNTPEELPEMELVEVVE